MIDFFKKTITWILKHKILTVFLTVGAAALVMLVPSLVAGTLTNMLAVEIMAIAGSVGLLELGLFAVHDLRVKSLKNKEVKLANKIAQNDATDELSNTMSQKKFYKICKKFTKVQLKLSKHQYHDKKPLSFSIRPLGLATYKQSKLYFKVKKLEAESNGYKSIYNSDMNSIAKSAGIKDATVIIANNIFNMVGENRPKYCNKVTINEDVKKTIKLTNVQIDIFFS